MYLRAVPIFCFGMAIHYKLLNKVHELSTPITSGIVSGTYLFWALHVKLLL